MNSGRTRGIYGDLRRENSQEAGNILQYASEKNISACDYDMLNHKLDLPEFPILQGQRSCMT